MFASSFAIIYVWPHTWIVTIRFRYSTLCAFKCARIRHFLQFHIAIYSAQWLCVKVEQLYSCGHKSLPPINITMIWPDMSGLNTGPYSTICLCSIHDRHLYKVKVNMLMEKAPYKYLIYHLLLSFKYSEIKMICNWKKKSTPFNVVLFMHWVPSIPSFLWN